MNTRFHLVRLLAVLFLLSGLVVSVVPPAASQAPQVQDGVLVSSEEPLAVSAVSADPPVVGKGIIYLGAESFIPYYQTTTWLRSDLMLRASGAGIQPFDAPLVIPSGAKIKQIVLYYMDNDASANISLFVVTHAYSSSFGVANPSVVSTDAAAGIRYLTMTDVDTKLPLDTSNNRYFLRVNLPGGGNVAFNAVRIEYSYDTSMPVVTK